MAAQPLVTGEFYGERQRQSRCGGIVISELKHRRKKSLPEHTHESAYLCMLLAGSYREVFGSRTIAYERLDAVLHPPGFTHHDFIGSQGGHFLTVEMGREWLKSMQVLCPRLRIEPALLCGESARLARRLRAEQQEADAWSLLAVEGILLEILADTARAQARPDCTRPPWVHRATELLRARVPQHLTLAELALELGVDPLRLSRTYKRFTGESIAATRMRFRLEAVQHALRNPRLSLSEIALDNGFADQSHMTRQFRRFCGITPGEFRKANPCVSKIFPVSC